MFLYNMNKILIAIFLFAGFVANAQDSDQNSDNATVSFAPQGGDLTLGLDIMSPLTAAFGSGPTMQTVFAKYFLSDELVLRTKLQAGLDYESNSQLITDDSNLDPLNRVKAMDVRNTQKGNFGIALGLEKRNSRAKLQTFYGLELFVAYSYSTQDFQRGNALSEVNQSASFYDYDSGLETSSSTRVIERDYGTDIGFGANIFAGMEYYFTKHLAIGSEISMGYQYTIKGQETDVNEYYQAGLKQETIAKSASDISNKFQMAKPYVSVYVMFTL